MMTSAPSTSWRPVRAALLLGLIAGALAGTLGAWLVLEVIKRSTSSTAAVAIIVIPEVAVRYGAPSAAFGAALGVLISGLRAQRSLRRPEMLLSSLVVVVLGGWGAALVGPRLVVRPEVRRVAHLSEPDLGAVLESRWFGRDVYVLAAIAANSRASPQTLDRIAQRPDPELQVRPGNNLLDILVSDSRDLDHSVTLLLARNPGTPAESLEGLATSPDCRVLAAVARHPKVSPATLARLSASSEIEIRRGVASNPSASPEILELLSRDSDRGTRLGVASNRATPPEVRKRLQSDLDAYVRDSAIGGIRAEATDTPLLVR